MTNSIPETIPYLDHAIKLNNALLGLPGGLISVVGCLAIGYFLKVMPFVKNRYIPMWVFLFGIIANVFITPIANVGDGFRAVILGMVAAVAAVVIHRRFLASYDKEFITETTETSHIIKDSRTGITEIGGSKTVTTTPTEPKP